MTSGESRTAGLIFLALMATVSINLFAFQQKRRGIGLEPLVMSGSISGAPMSDDTSGTTLLARDGPDLSRAPVPALVPALVQGPMRISPPTAVEPATSKAEIVRGVQRELNTRGYAAGPPDGVVGLVTRASILAYETDFGLPLTAEPSADLLSRIVLGTSAPPPDRPVARGDVVASTEAQAVILSVEQQLSALGYAPGKIDGKTNEQTARAIRTFEVAQKLPETGRISGPLVSRLIRMQGQISAPAAQVVPSLPARAPVRAPTRAAQR